MKKILIALSIFAGLTSCGNSDTAADAKTPEQDRVEVLYFHGKQRCATCMAIERNTAEVIETEFASEIGDGSLVFRTIDISTPEGESLADEYEVTWSSLFVNKWEKGRETRNNMTEFGFGNARNKPELFKKILSETIRQSMK